MDLVLAIQPGWLHRCVICIHFDAGHGFMGCVSFFEYLFTFRRIGVAIRYSSSSGLRVSAWLSVVISSIHSWTSAHVPCIVCKCACVIDFVSFVFWGKRPSHVCRHLIGCVYVVCVFSFVVESLMSGWVHLVFAILVGVFLLW